MTMPQVLLLNKPIRNSIVHLIFAGMLNVTAHDPIIIPSENQTAELTKSLVENYKQEIDYEGSYERFLEILSSPSSMISQHIKLDYSNVVFPIDSKFTLKEKDISWVESIKTLANEIGATVEILPGKIVLSTPSEANDEENPSPLNKVNDTAPKPQQSNQPIQKTDLKEITSEEEKSTSFPWWIIGLVVLLAVAFFLLKGKSKH